MNTWPVTGASTAFAVDAICATLPGVHSQSELVVRCEKNAVGRYLVIRIDAFHSTLVLCEVQVFAFKEVPSKYTNHAVLYFRLPRCGVALCCSFSCELAAKQKCFPFCGDGRLS